MAAKSQADQALRAKLFSADAFPPAAGAPAGTIASLPLARPVRLGKEAGELFQVLHFPEMTGEHMEHFPVGAQPRIAELFQAASALGGYPLALFRRLSPVDVTRLTALLLGPRFLGEQVPEAGGGN